MQHFLLRMPPVKKTNVFSKVLSPVALSSLIFVFVFSLMFAFSLIIRRDFSKTRWPPSKMCLEGNSSDHNLSDQVALIRSASTGLRGKSWPGLEHGSFFDCLPAGSRANSPPFSYLEVRKQFTWPWIAGKHGIEIGALQQPFALPAETTIKYVDSKTIEQLRHQYPELASVPLVAPDIIDKAETLSTISDGSQQFVLASHVIEHTENTVLAVRNMLRVLEVGGVLVLIAPMKCEIFDRHRVVTSWEHLWTEYIDPSVVQRNRFEHFREWVAGTGSGVQGAPVLQDVDERARELMKMQYAVHFHAWDQTSFRLFLNQLQVVGEMPFEIREYVAHKYETIVVLERMKTENRFPSVDHHL